MEKDDGGSAKQNLILQTVSQAYAHRLALYASSPTLSPHVFPRNDAFCDRAEELGKVESEYNGPCLVLLHNCSLTAQQLLPHIRSTFLRGYIMRVYWCQNIASTKAHMVAHIRSLLKSLTPNTNKLSCFDAEDKAAMQDEFGGLVDIDHVSDNYSRKSFRFRIQTHPRELADDLVHEFGDFDCVLHDFTHSIYVVEADGNFLYGLDEGFNMYLAPSNRVSLSKGVSKASTKVEEALRVANFDLHKDMLVLDVGAAPGAWTEYVSHNVKTVLAIDPGRLCDQAQQKNVIHICKKAEEAHAELESWTTQRLADLLVCDINKHPIEAVKIILSLIKYLKPGGRLVLTLKFHGRGKVKESKLKEVYGLFHGILRNTECIWLMANSIYERTFMGIKLEHL